MSSKRPSSMSGWHFEFEALSSWLSAFFGDRKDGMQQDRMGI
eukprot:CAMPEP_0206602088 /NCGR_PEP_ID=MMETSP0325_2-20121206/47122_1 /ASSEMBLY_ACC=CAM_ASM_000347 /TAXON_ID=2866 /ORGANISM="Crypthecodinium cohnii, Strain Seligo" /LENGTH=41 /DNA_ID= /DNA_START= /DNA_END= /DNA_ORIENTATION=